MIEPSFGIKNLRFSFLYFSSNNLNSFLIASFTFTVLASVFFLIKTPSDWTPFIRYKFLYSFWISDTSATSDNLITPSGFAETTVLEISSAVLNFEDILNRD